MLRKLFAYFFGFLAFLFATIGLFVVCVRLELLNPDLYISSIDQSGIYKELADLSNKQIDKIFENSEKNKSEEGSDFGAQFSGSIVNALLENIDLEELLRTTASNNIINLTEWAKGNDPELMVYFPRSVLTDAYGGANSRELFIDHFLRASGIEDLPECSEYHSYESLKGIESVDDLPCVNDQLRELVSEELAKHIPEDQDFNFVDEVIEQNLGDIDEETRLASLIDKPNRQNFISGMNRAQEILNYIKLGGVIAILVSGLLALFSALLAQKKLLAILKIYFNASMILLLISLIFKYISEPVINILFWSQVKLPADILDAEQVVRISEILKNIMAKILADAFDTLLLVSAIMFIITLLSRLILYFLFYRKEEVDEEHLEEDLAEDESEEEEEDESPKIDKDDFEKQLLSKSKKN